MNLLSSVILVCWLIFWVYWFISAFNSKRNVNHTLRHFVGLRLIFVLAAVIIIHYTSRNNSIFHAPVITNPVLQAVGVVLFIAGLALAIWARRNLGRNWGMPMSQKKDPELVISGPYKYIRHPIYTGILLAVVGSVLAASVYWIFLFVITAPYFIFSAFYEDRLMLKMFPKAYPAYKAQTKMLIPFIL